MRSASQALPGAQPTMRDLIIPRRSWLLRESNHAGGLEGGMTNGLPLIVSGR